MAHVSDRLSERVSDGRASPAGSAADVEPRATGDVPCTVIIAAKDEAAEIAECIASVDWAAEIIVVENDSSDETVSVARAAGAVVFSHPFSTIGRQRNAAIARASRLDPGR